MFYMSCESPLKQAANSLTISKARIAFYLLPKTCLPPRAHPKPSPNEYPDHP